MRRIQLIVSGILSFVGLIWGLQGIGVLEGSPMTGQPFWAWAGLALLTAGLALLYFGIRRRT